MFNSLWHNMPLALPGLQGVLAFCQFMSGHLLFLSLDFDLCPIRAFLIQGFGLGINLIY